MTEIRSLQSTHAPTTNFIQCSLIQNITIEKALEQALLYCIALHSILRTHVTNARNTVNKSIRRAKHCGYYDSDLPLFDKLCDNADEQLFDNVRRNSHHSDHTLHNLLPRNR